MQPCPCLGRRDRPSIKMAGGGSPSCRAKSAPVRAGFALRQIDEAVARKDSGWFSIRLRAKKCVMLMRPLVHRCQIMLLHQLRQRLPPVAFYIGSVLGIRHQRWEVLPKI